MKKRQQIILIEGIPDSTKVLFTEHLSKILKLPIISVYTGVCSKNASSVYFEDVDFFQFFANLIRDQSFDCIIVDSYLSRAVFALFNQVSVTAYDLMLDSFFTDNRINFKLLYFVSSLARLKQQIAKTDSDFDFEECSELQALYEHFLTNNPLPFMRLHNGSTINIVEVCDFIAKGE
ncbi:hypothetical protein KKF45_05665 [Patescibacteria group bacterium]|nr:hypothetical protein [Patescibacteria group bacterium]